MQTDCPKLIESCLLNAPVKFHTSSSQVNGCLILQACLRAFTAGQFSLVGELWEKDVLRGNEFVEDSGIESRL